MRRRLRIILTAVAAGAVALVLTVPWWLGVAVKTAGPRWGLTVGNYQRAGYARFVATDVVYQRKNVRVTVALVEADTPMLWLWRRGIGKVGSVTVGRWKVDVTAPPVPAPPAAALARGWMPLRTTLQRVAAGLDRWLPRAKLGEGTVNWPRGGLSLAGATWDKRTLAVRALKLGSLAMDGSVAVPAEGDEFRLAAKIPEQGGGAALVDHAGNISGDVSWWEQRATVTARFGEAGWLPAEASFRADNWSVPASRLKLGELYAAVRGNAQIDWSAKAFHADVAVTGEPLADKKAPPLQATLRGRGDLQAFTVETLHATLPGMVADLSAPVTIERAGKFREGAAHFTAQVDLARQPWFAARGAVSVEARLNSGAGAAPAMEFRATAHDVVAEEVAISDADVAGRLTWPRIQVTTAMLVGAEGEHLRGSGGWDFRTKEMLDAAIEGEVRRATVERWLPAQPRFDTVAVSARANGPLASVKHEGEAKAEGVTFPSMKPLTFTLAWNGTGSAIEKFSATVAAAATKLTAAGAVDHDALRLTACELTQGGAKRLRLAQPATVVWRPAWRIKGVKLTGPTSGLDVEMTWGAAGRVAVELRGFSSAWLGDLIDLPGPPWELNAMKLTGDWDRGPMTFTASAGATIALGDERKAVVDLSARGGKDGLQLEALRVAEGAAAIVTAAGRAPVTLSPGSMPLVRIDPGGALALDAATESNATFWQKLAALTGCELVDPVATAHVAGTWAQPLGDVRLQATRVAVDATRIKRPVPTVEGLDVAVTGDRDGVRLDRFAVKVEGQQVSAHGRLPMGRGDWSEVAKQPVAFLQRAAEVHLEVPEAEVAVFARFLPAFLAPQGRVELNVDYQRGAMDGILRLRDAASRPLGPLGVLQEISAEVRLAGRKLELTKVTAMSGGQPVTLTGSVELPPVNATGAGATAAARYDLALHGENLPFVRQTGLLVRGDLDLKLQTPAGATPQIGGTVRLRDSLFLADVRSFLDRSGGANPARRPPYFSVGTQPLDEWRLAIDVSGARFLRLRTPVFSGVVSARFRLGGTLGEPRATGEATIDEGQVLMPFARFDVKEGAVRLTQENPYEPSVFVRGTGRRFGYDLSLEVSGAATKPTVTLSSSPALDSEQVLLMVMTGAAPSNEISYSGTQRATRIGAFLGQSLLNTFGGDPAKADRLTITSGEQVSQQGKETYGIEYKLADRWTLVGEYDEFDDYNAGIKWRAFPAKRDKEAPAGGHAEK